MRVVLWDSRQQGASKDFAGGFGVGIYPGRGKFGDWAIRQYFARDRRPVALLFAHMAAIFSRLGHSVEYTEDRIVDGADLYVFCPSLITLPLELQAISQVTARNPGARVLVVGLVATVMPEAFEGLGVIVVKGEAEQLFWRLDEVLLRPAATVQLGTIEDLDSLPLPDWSLFQPWKFRIRYDFRRFPTALIQSSRGCLFGCNYCPYVILDNSVRFRDAEAVVDEMRHGIRRWGFRSFKFRDPLFGLNRNTVFRMAELIGRLPRKIEFSIETRIELMRPEILRVLRRVGLSSITVGIETPNDETLRHWGRKPIPQDRQREFIETCRRMGIRTVAGFMIGFPEDTPQSIHRVLNYAMAINPTFANFNVVTPYPGTEFFEQIKDRIEDFHFNRYTIYTPVLKYEHMTGEQLSALLARCFRRFYFRWEYLLDNAALFWPVLRRLRRDRTKPANAAADPPHAGVPQPLSGGELLRRRGLRTDGPHPRPGVPGQTGDPRKAE